MESFGRRILRMGFTVSLPPFVPLRQDDSISNSPIELSGLGCTFSFAPDMSEHDLTDVLFHAQLAGPSRSSSHSSVISALRASPSHPILCSTHHPDRYLAPQPSHGVSPGPIGSSGPLVLSRIHPSPALVLYPRSIPPVRPPLSKSTVLAV